MRFLAVVTTFLAALDVCYAQSGTFVIPAIRASGGTDFAFWDLFARNPNLPGNTNYNYANPPALADGLGEDGDSNPTTVFAPRATLIQNGTTSCFVTSSGAIYSFDQTIAFEVLYQPPAGNTSEVTNVIFQVQTGGSRLDLNSLRLQYTAVGGSTQQVSPVFKALDDPQTGAFSERLVSAFQWNLTGLGVKQFKIVFSAPGPSMPVWQAQLDVVQGSAFVQQLGYILRTTAAPVTRFGKPGAVDKNLPPSADGRYFLENDVLNLLAIPETDWQHTGWSYLGGTSSSSSFPLIFPANDVTVTALFAPTSYSVWREFMFNHANSLLGQGDDYTNDAISAPTVDHDGDTLNNAGEYAFAGDPYTSDTVRTKPQMLVVDVSGVIYPAIRYRSNGMAVGMGDVIHTPQLSTDGTTWINNGTVPTTTTFSRVLQNDGSMLVTERALQPVSALSGVMMRVAWSVGGTAGIPLEPAALALNADTAPDSWVGTDYTHAFTATGGATPYEWTLDSGSTLPAGLALSSAGVLSGRPTVAGNSSFTLKVTDGVGTSLTLPVELVISSYEITSASTLTNAVSGLPYSVTLAVQGGTAPFTWSVLSGSLPSGMALNGQGQLTGSSTAAGSYNFTLEVQDDHGLQTTKAFALQVVSLIITTGSDLPGCVVNVPYDLPLSASGGASPYDFGMMVGSLPDGLSLSSAGVISGTPTSAGTSQFTVRVTDDNDVVSTRAFTLVVYAAYQKPIIEAMTPPAGTVGAAFSHAFTAVNYPNSFSVVGLPPGLKMNPITGVVTGRPTSAGVYVVQVRASNTAGTGPTVSLPLVIKTVPVAMVGSFSGWMQRDPAANAKLGGRWSLTTTSKGTYTLKVIIGRATFAASGFMAVTAPQIQAVVGGQALSLSVDPVTHLVSGTHGVAAVRGWRSIWHKTYQPAEKYVGGYSAGLALTNVADDGVITIPQGRGFLTMSVTSAGSVSVSGKTADGQTLSSTSSLGPNGEIAVVNPLYKGKGTLIGALLIHEDPLNPFIGSRVNGALTWSKPMTSGKTYASGFDVIEIGVDGAYLTSSFKSGVVLGLPQTGNVLLTFTDGGLQASATDPDLAALPFTDLLRFLPPASVVKHSLTLKPATGAITGSIILTEVAPPATRKVTFQAQIVRTTLGTTRAVGFFMLPQLDGASILSGGVNVEQ
jgi:hypothetical protein